jgi:multicomponent Na+:H+ antiporter subunit E
MIRAGPARIIAVYGKGFGAAVTRVLARAGDPDRYSMARRVSALFCWAFAVWVLLTWTFTAQQLLFGAAAAVVVALALAPLGAVAGPWQLLTPGRLGAMLRLLFEAGWRIVAANLRLSRLIWDPRLPLRSGMVVVPTRERSAGGLTAVGLITSVIVDNQLVDLDPSRGQLQYHAVEVPAGGPDQARAQINGPTEALLTAFHPAARPDSPP